ncbi:MAG: hypothetical protein U0835_10075 [Isosphaeraceae bacterium]
MTFTLAAVALMYPVTPPPADLKLDPFYARHVSAGGIPVVGSAKVSDFALKEAAFLIDRMLEKRPDVRATMVRNRARCVVMAASERTTDVPEHRDLKPKEFWDVRARGLGATRRNPVVSCAEENLLGLKGDPYKGENILIHEFGHAIQSLGLNDVDPDFSKKLRAAYDSALAKGLWKGTYAASNPGEYWAEAVQSWFDANLAPADFQHNHVNTREELKAYDPALAALAASAFGEDPWRYQPPAARPDLDSSHLKGFDPSRAPAFSWGAAKAKYDEVVAEKRRLRLEEQKRQEASPPRRP